MQSVLKGVPLSLPFAHAEMENQAIDLKMKVRTSLHLSNEVWDMNSTMHYAAVIQP